MRHQSLSRKTRRALPLAALLLLLSAALLVALTLGNADGVWSNAISYGGEGTAIECLGYSDQGASLTDENIVRYGRPDDYYASNCTPFDNQSGFGFDGTDGPLTFEPGVDFVLGQFTHYNNIIQITTMDQRLRTVDLEITLAFNDPAALNPVLHYTMLLDETINSASPCPYGDSTGNGCDDKVTFPGTIPDQTFDIDGVTYTLQITGFVPGTMPACASGTPVDNFVTGEERHNDACLFGRILEVTYDYGDAPDHNGQTIDPTTAAAHTIDLAGPFLGATPPDNDACGYLCLLAEGDDDMDVDDEDGFDFVYPDPTWFDGSGSIAVTVSNLEPFSTACVTGWIDYAGDGFANDTPTAVTATANGAVTLAFNLPGPPPPSTPLRLRLIPGDCPETPISPAGLLQGGEVEDYLISVPTAVRLHSFRAAPALPAWLELLRP